VTLEHRTPIPLYCKKTLKGFPHLGYATPVEGETTYTVDEAAAILEESPERVLEMLQTGELDGIPPGATLAGEWKVLLPSTATGESAESAEEFVEPPSQSGAESEESATASEQLSRGGSNAPTAREPTAPSGWVSTQQAARALGISARTVRWHIEQGNLEAKPEGEGVRRSWLVSIDSLQAFRDARQAARDMPRSHRAPSEAADIAAEGSGEAIRVLAERLEEAAARAAEYRVRLELTAQAESTLRAELEEVRQRRDDLERERDELRRELETLRGRPPEPRESPVRHAPTESPTGAGGGPQEAREATQSAAETLRGPESRPTTGGAQESLQRSPQPGRRRGRLWRRVFGGG
jgi:helix-turn-helix protein